MDKSPVAARLEHLLQELQSVLPSTLTTDATNGAAAAHHVTAKLLAVFDQKSTKNVVNFNGNEINEVLQSVAISNLDGKTSPRTHHAFLAIVSNNAKACIHGRWRAQLQLTTSQVSVHPVDAKQAEGCGIIILSHHVACVACRVALQRCCVVFGQWCQFHDDKLQGDVLRAQLPTASDSLPMTRWRNAATLHDMRLWWCMGTLWLYTITSWDKI